MFGENQLLGLEKINIRSDGSIILPEFTEASDYEKLIFFCFENNLALYSPITIFAKLDSFFDKQKDKLNLRELLVLKRFVYVKTLSEEYVRSNKKIFIPKKAREHLNSNIYVKGYSDNIRFFNSLEDIKKYELTLK